MQEILMKLNPIGLNIIGAISIIFLLGVMIDIIVISAYNDIRRSFAHSNKKGESNYKKKVLNKIVEDFISSFKRNEIVNTQAIIENNFYRLHRSLIVGERFSKSTVSLMIILGLLGTFFGLTLSIGELVTVISGSSNAGAIETILEGLINSINGMSVAFITSLFGIVGSVIITIINVFFNIAESKENLFVEIEDYLDNILTQKLGGSKELLPDGIVKGNSKVNLTYDPNNMSASLEKVSVALLKTVDNFDKAIEKFNVNTTDFSQFNHELRTNIERMNVTLGDFITDLKEIKKK